MLEGYVGETLCGFESHLQHVKNIDLKAKMKKIIFTICISVNLFANVDDYIQKINEFINNESYDLALETFNTALNEYDASSKLYYIGGNIYLKLDDLDLANKYLVKAIELDPKNVQFRKKQEELSNFKLLLTSAKKTFDIGHMEDAIIEYEKLCNQYSSYAIVFYNLGLIYKANQEYQLAVKNYNIAKTLNPFEIKYDKAVKVISQIIAQNGDVNFRRQNFELAIKNYNDAISYYPKYTKAIFKLARTYYRQNDFDNALIILKKGLTIDPAQEQNEKMLGDIYRKNDNQEEAVNHYKLAININSNYYQALYSLGSMYLNIGELEEARNALNNAVKIEPTYSKAYGALGAVEQEMGNMDRSIDNYIEAVKYDKKAYDIHYRLASAYNFKKHHEEAKKSAKQSINIKRNYAPAFFELGLAEKSLGNKVAAKDAFEKAKKDRNWRKSAQFELDMISKGL